jgi:hypothetical protein
LRESRERLRTIDQTVMAYARRGETVPWSHVRAGGRPDDRETYGLLDTLEVGTRAWTVLDYICANPSCRCEEAKLAFHLVDDEDAHARVRVRVPLGGGETQFEAPEGLTLAEAREVFASWEEMTGHDRAVLFPGLPGAPRSR